jgi:hypothetical protein
MTWLHTLEDHNLNIHRSGKLQSHTGTERFELGFKLRYRVDQGDTNAFVHPWVGYFINWLVS